MSFRESTLREVECRRAMARARLALDEGSHSGSTGARERRGVRLASSCLARSVDAPRFPSRAVSSKGGRS
jgi:hypothetical protein